MEQEISIKEIFFYCLRRWYIFALCVALSGVAGIILRFTVFTEEYGMERQYRASVYLFPYDTYMRNFDPSYTDLDLQNSWEDERPRAMDALFAVDNYVCFLEMPQNAALVKKVTTAPDPNKYLQDRMKVVGQHRGAIIKFDTTEPKEREEDIINLLNAYAAFLRARAFEDAPVFEKMKDVGSVSIEEAKYIGSVQSDFSGSAFILYFVLGGFALAAVTVLLMYFFFDPRLKSAGEVERRGFRVLAKIPDRKFHAPELSGLIVALDGFRRVCISDPDGPTDAPLADFCSVLASALAQAGNRVLWIDGSVKQSGAGKFSEYLFGAELRRCVTRQDGVDVTAFTQKGDFLSFSPKSARIEALDALYDKVIISIDASIGGAVSAVSAQCDATVCLISPQKAKSANLKHFCRELSPRAKKAGAVLYGCKE